MQQQVLAINLAHHKNNLDDNVILDSQAEMVERKKLLPKYQAMAAVVGEAAAMQAMNQEVKDNVIMQGKAHKLVLKGLKPDGSMDFQKVESIVPRAAEKPKTAKQLQDELGVGGEWKRYETEGIFDEHKALKSAEAKTIKELGDRPKEHGEKQDTWDARRGFEADIINNKYRAAQAAKRGEGQQAEADQPAQQQQEQPPVEQKPVKVGSYDTEIKSLRDRGVSPSKIGYLKEMLSTMKTLSEKGAAQPLTQQEKDDLKSLYVEYQRLSKE